MSRVGTGRVDRVSRARHNSNLFRIRVIELLRKGLSVSKIAKKLGKSYVHTKQIAEQERDNV